MRSMQATLLLGLLVEVCLVQTCVAQRVADFTKTELSQLISQLGSDRFQLRQSATRSLVRAGKQVIPRVSAAVANSNPEISQRAMQILAKLGESLDTGTADSAHGALLTLQDSRVPAITTYAKNQLQHLDALRRHRESERLRSLARAGEMSEEQATAQLEALGATVRKSERHGCTVAVGGEKWQGQDPDLIYVTALKDVRRLDLNGITDGALSHIEGLSSLTVLHVSGISNTGLPLIASFPSLKSLSIRSDHVTDAGLVHLSDLHHLESINLPKGVTDAGLVHLKGLKNLKSLEFTNAIQIEGSGLRHLSDLDQLAHLNLSYTSTRGEYLEDVAQLPRLTSLHTSQSAMTDVGMPHIAKMTSLKQLSVFNTAVTDAGFAHVSDLTNLEGLYIAHNPCLTDAGLAHVSGLKNLRRLFIGSNNITDDCLQFLQNFEKLQILHLDRTFLTPEGVSELSILYPTARVSSRKTWPDPGEKHFKAVRTLAPLGGKIYSHVANRGGKRTFITEAFFAAGWTGGSEDFLHLRNLDGLETLDIRTPIEDSAIDYLSQIDVKTVSLQNPYLKDYDLQFLQNIPSLKQVRLQGPFSDRAIPFIRPLKQLTFLRFSGSDLTEDGIAEVKRLFPRARIVPAAIR